ncbi:MAG: GNAT family N-acetyltransferase [Thermoleophilia bacterium]
MRITPVSPHDPAVLALLAASDAYHEALYPAESNHLEDPDDLDRPNVALFGGFVDGTLAAIGAIKLVDGDVRYAEVKRVWVDPAHRGGGRSKLVMAHLEDEARARGAAVARLETGISQPEAIGLYRRLGYAERPPFGDYLPDPLSIFMEKPLAG